LEDTTLSDTKRWVKASPPGNGNCSLLLGKAANDDQLSQVGNQTGGRVFLFLNTYEFWRDFNNYTSKGVQFVSEPVKKLYETVAVFKDLYGNLWDIIEPVKE